MYAAGLDFGTSGARLAIIDETAHLVFAGRCPFDSAIAKDWSNQWLEALACLFRTVPQPVREQLGAIAINGTSATVLLCDAQGQPVTEPLLYNDDCGQAWQGRLQAIAPPGNPTLSATSSLVKLLWWQATLPPSWLAKAQYFMHQADWLAFQLHGQPGRSDYHNALKLGYDVGRLTYPDWLLSLGLTHLLPQVQAPGTLQGYVTTVASDRYGLPIGCPIFAGTTDSIAAFLASGARQLGEAVTSLGSTLVIKLLSQNRLDNNQYGIYSHRFGDLWLVGGASNTGGRVLKHFFTDEELQTLSQQIASDRPSGLNYYPLLQPGERFPINDPSFLPQLSPRPASATVFLHGLLEGIARVESQGYRLLQELGATPLKRVLTAGGGAQNSTWTAIRQQFLPVPVAIAPSTEAAVGTAQLALEGWQGAFPKH